MARTSAPGSVTNTATVSGKYGDPNLGNNAASANTTVAVPSSNTRKLADLAIADRSKKRRVHVGDRVTYLLTVRNAGPDTATGLKVIDHSYSGLRVMKAPRYCGRKRMLHCKIKSLAKGRSFKFSVVALVTQKGRLKNAASVSALETDPSKKNNKSRAKVAAMTR